jgi:hypothetical protein
MKYFEKMNVTMPDFWSYLAGPHWRSTGSIKPQGLAVADLNRDGRDDFIFQFWQDLGYLNYGSSFSGGIPNRLVVLLAGPQGYVDVTSSYFSAADQFIDGVSLHPTVADINLDGYPDLWMIVNQEDGRQSNDLNDMAGANSLFLFDPIAQKFVQTRPAEMAWWFYGGSFELNDKAYFWGAGTSKDDVFQTVYLSNDSALSVGLAAVYVYDNKTKTIVRESGLPGGGSGPVLVSWAKGDATQYVVTTGHNANTQANFLGLWARTSSGWDLADATNTQAYVPFEYMGWNGTQSTIHIDPITKLSTPAYLHPLTMRLNEDTDPVIVYFRNSFQVGQPSADGVYYERDLSTVRFLEFWSVKGNKLVQVPIKILNEATNFNTEVSEIKDINLDGVDDWITYPYDTLGAPIVYLGTGGDVMVRVPQQVFPQQPSDWARGPEDLVGTSRFVHADSDPLWDLIIYPGQSMPSEWRGNPLVEVYRSEVNASPVIYRGLLKDVGSAVKDAIHVQDRLGSKKIFTFAGNDSITDVKIAAGGATLDGGLGTDTSIYSSNLKDYQLARSANGAVTVTSKAAGSGPQVSDTLINIERLQFKDFSVNLTIQSQVKTLDTALVTRIQELYVAFFNRVPDADGLSHWMDQAKNGMSIPAIADAFYAAGVQYTALTGFSAAMTNADFVNTIYRNVLGRKDGADAEGLAYWTGELSAGHATRGSLVSTILDSAHSFKGDATWGWVADLLDNKITVAQKVSVDWGLNYLTPDASIANGMAIAKAVTPTNTDVAIALVGIPLDAISLT